MRGSAAHGGGRILNVLRILGWGGVASFLLLPAVAMQFTNEVVWTASDFLAAGLMLGSAGLAMELAVRKSGNLAYRFGAGIAIAASFGLVWVNLAVGFLGDEGNPANLMFLSVLAVALVGSAMARFQAAGMSKATFAAAATQVLIGVIALAAGWASPGPAGLYEVTLGTGLFTGLWLFSAWLLREAAR
jgi:hypothetical protein